MGNLSDYSIQDRFNATVKKTTRFSPENTDEVRELVLEIDHPDFSYQLGQSIGVLLEGNASFGEHYHHRLYSVADIPAKKGKKPQIKILVRRCTYVDDVNGERYPGMASNFLCDRKVGDTLTVTGPFGLPFTIPEDKTTDLLLIGLGTGIAPFRALVKHIYKNVKEWKGKIRLFYGARSGLELLYMNDKNDDMSNYYDEETFQAFKALSPRPHWADPIALDFALEQRSEEILAMLEKSTTRIYVAGYEKIEGLLEKAFSKIMGSETEWKRRKAELVAGGRWVELIY